MDVSSCGEMTDTVPSWEEDTSVDTIDSVELESKVECELLVLAERLLLCLVESSAESSRSN